MLRQGFDKRGDPVGICIKEGTKLLEPSHRISIGHDLLPPIDDHVIDQVVPMYSSIACTHFNLGLRWAAGLGAGNEDLLHGIRDWD